MSTPHSLTSTRTATDRTQTAQGNWLDSPQCIAAWDGIMYAILGQGGIKKGITPKGGRGSVNHSPPHGIYGPEQ